MSKRCQHNRPFVNSQGCELCLNDALWIPYPEKAGATHWDDCFRHRGHHNCAVRRIMALESRVQALEAENGRLREAARFAVLALAHANECSPGLYTEAYEKLSAALEG